MGYKLGNTGIDVGLIWRHRLHYCIQRDAAERDRRARELEAQREKFLLHDAKCAREALLADLQLQRLVLSLSKHVSAVCGSANFHIRALRHIRRALTEDMAKALAVSLVQSPGLCK